VTLITLAAPLAFGLGSLLARYAGIPTTPASIVRSAAVILAFALVSLLAGRVLTRSWNWGVLAASSLVLYTLGEMLLVFPLVLFMLWWPLVGLLRRRRGKSISPAVTPSVARAAGLFAFIYLAVMSLSAGQTLLDRPSLQVPVYEADGAGGPNVYLILLDGYPRDDTLSQTFGADNSAFLQDLEGLGFSVSREARSNYAKTWLTLASMLNGAYVDDMLGDQPIPATSAGQHHWLHAIIDRAAVLDAFRDRGYGIRTIPTPFPTTSLTSADEILDPGVINDFEARLLWQSPWMRFFGDQVTSMLLGSRRDEVQRALEITIELAQDPGAQPQFVFAHVYSPHPPSCSGRIGRPAGSACQPVSRLHAACGM